MQSLACTAELGQQGGFGGLRLLRSAGGGARAVGEEFELAVLLWLILLPFSGTTDRSACFPSAPLATPHDLLPMRSAAKAPTATGWGLFCLWMGRRLRSGVKVTSMEGFIRCQIYFLAQDGETSTVVR
jgi:hypothetical protein